MDLLGKLSLVLCVRHSLLKSSVLGSMVDLHPLTFSFFLLLFGENRGRFLLKHGDNLPLQLALSLEGLGNQVCFGPMGTLGCDR